MSDKDSDKKRRDNQQGSDLDREDERAKNLVKKGWDSDKPDKPERKDK